MGIALRCHYATDQRPHRVFSPAHSKKSSSWTPALSRGSYSYRESSDSNEAIGLRSRQSLAHTPRGGLYGCTYTKFLSCA
jgi:hypothetical protein